MATSCFINAHCVTVGMSKSTELMRVHIMTIQELKHTIGTLAQSQGYYERLYRGLSANDKWGDFLKLINDKGIDSPVDLILFIEG